MHTTRWTAPGRGASVAALLEALEVEVGGFGDLVREAFNAEVENDRTGLDIVPGGAWDRTDTSRIRAAVAEAIESRWLARSRRVSDFQAHVFRQRATRLAQAKRAVE